MAWLNPRIKVKSRSQLINKLMVACSGIAKVLTFGLSHNDPRPSAYGCPQDNTKAKHIINGRHNVYQIHKYLCNQAIVIFVSIAPRCVSLGYTRYSVRDDTSGGTTTK